LPASWQRVPDAWDNRDRIERIKSLEIILAAGVIARILGNDWRKVVSENRSVDVIHKDGYGFHLRRDWRNSNRFAASPLHRYKHNEPASIGFSANRTLGSIAADIKRRLVDNGLAEAFKQQQESDNGRREERRERFAKINAAAKAFGGHVMPKRNWTQDGYPEASIPGGRAKIGYGFHGGDVEIEISCHIETAEKIGKALKEINDA
jgi:hypothetical protein